MSATNLVVLPLPEAEPDCNPTFNRKYDYGEEEGHKDRHDETTFVDSTCEVDRMSCGIVTLEVAGCAHTEEEDADSCYCACNDYEKRVADTTHVADFLFLFHFGCH